MMKQATLLFNSSSRALRQAMLVTIGAAVILMVSLLSTNALAAPPEKVTVELIHLDGQALAIAFDHQHKNHDGSPSLVYFDHRKLVINRLRDGRTEHIAGNGKQLSPNYNWRDGSRATDVPVCTHSLATDLNGAVYFSYLNSIVVLSPTPGKSDSYVVRKVASGPSGENISSISPLDDGSLLISGQYGIRRINAKSGEKIEDVTAVRTFRQGKAQTQPHLFEVSALSLTGPNKSGDFIGSDTNTQRIFRLEKLKTAVKLAGQGDPRSKSVKPNHVKKAEEQGQAGFSADGTLATSALLAGPSSAVEAPDGRIIFADRGNLAIRAIDHDGKLITIADKDLLASGGEHNRFVELLEQGGRNFLLVFLGLIVADNGDIYVTQPELNRVLKINTHGAFARPPAAATKASGNDGATLRPSESKRDSDQSLPPLSPAAPVSQANDPNKPDPNKPSLKPIIEKFLIPEIAPTSMVLDPIVQPGQQPDLLVFDAIRTELIIVKLTGTGQTTPAPNSPANNSQPFKTTTAISDFGCDPIITPGNNGSFFLTPGNLSTAYIATPTPTRNGFTSAPIPGFNDKNYTDPTGIVSYGSNLLIGSREGITLADDRGKPQYALTAVTGILRAAASAYPLPASVPQLASPVIYPAGGGGGYFIIDCGTNRIFWLSADLQTCNRIAGRGDVIARPQNDPKKAWAEFDRLLKDVVEEGFSPDGTLAAQALLAQPTDVARLPDGTIIFLETGNGRVRGIDKQGKLFTIATPKDLDIPFGPNGIAQPRQAKCQVSARAWLSGLVVTPNGDIYVSQAELRRLVKITNVRADALAADAQRQRTQDRPAQPTKKSATTTPVKVEPVIPPDPASAVSVWGGQINQLFKSPLSLRRENHAGRFGGFWVCDPSAKRILHIDEQSKLKRAVGVSFDHTKELTFDRGDGSEVAKWRFLCPVMITSNWGKVGAFHGHLIADRGIDNDRTGFIRLLAADGKLLTTVAGDGRPYAGNPNIEPHTNATAIAIAPEAVHVLQNKVDGTPGGFVVADSLRHAVLWVKDDGSVDYLIGGGRKTPSPEWQPARDVALGKIVAIKPGESGALLVDRERHSLYEVNWQTQQLRVIAGKGRPGYDGDDDDPTFATLNEPHDVATTRDGKIVIADTGNHALRQIVRKTEINRFGESVEIPVISTIAGTGTPGNTTSSDNPRTSQLNRPTSIHIRPNGYMYLVDSGNALVKLIKPLP